MTSVTALRCGEGFCLFLFRWFGVFFRVWFGLCCIGVFFALAKDSVFKACKILCGPLVHILRRGLLLDKIIF